MLNFSCGNINRHERLALEYVLHNQTIQENCQFVIETMKISRLEKGPEASGAEDVT